MPSRPPKIYTPPWKSGINAVSGNVEVEALIRKRETSLESPNRPPSRTEPPVYDVEKWLEDAAFAMRNDQAGVGANRRTRRAHEPIYTRSPNLPPAKNGGKEVDEGSRMEVRRGGFDDVMNEEKDKGKSRIEFPCESRDAQTIKNTPDPYIPDIGASDTKLVESLTELEKTLVSYKAYRKHTRGKCKFFCSFY